MTTLSENEAGPDPAPSPPPSREPEPSRRGGSAWKKAALLLLVAGGAALAYTLFRDALSLERLAQHEAALRQYQAERPVLVAAIAFCAYVLATGLSLPGAVILTLLCGWYFGLSTGIVLVSFASAAGASLAFLLSRHLLRDWVEARFGARLEAFNRALEREGAFYLFTLRLIPAVPFFVINAVMGLTRLRLWTFWWVSQLGMLAGTVVYVYAGSTLPGIEQIADPSQLRTSDIEDPAALAAALEAASRAPGSEPRAAVWSGLPDETRALIRDHASSPPALSDQERMRLVSGLNHVLRTASLDAAPAEGATTGKDGEKDRTRRNRAALVRLFPGEVHPPSPILSWQLLVAFALLGLFPIAAKKALNRFLPRREDAATERAERP